MERDAAWLAKVRAELLTWPREKLIGWLNWVDSNGIWSDSDMIANDMDPMTVEDAVEQVMAFVEESGESPVDSMAASLEKNPGRYPKPEEFDPWLKGTGDLPNQPKQGTFEWLVAKDRPAALSLRDLLGHDVHNQIEIDDGPTGYLVTHKGTGEVWEYDGANDMWLEV
jgi:hypothetical protein